MGRTLARLTSAATAASPQHPVTSKEAGGELIEDAENRLCVALQSELPVQRDPGPRPDRLK